jgi:hypothetical protein
VNGTPVRRPEELQAALAGARVGDRIAVDFVRGGARRTATVTLAPYEVTRVRIVELPQTTERQREMRRRWLLGDGSGGGAGTRAAHGQSGFRE